MMHRPVTSVLVKPAGPDCNLACEYCFYSSKERLYPTGPRRMSEAVLEAMIRQMLAQPVAQVSFGWQGGEPTLMGVPFYRKAIDMMQRYGKGQAVANGLQTNGLLIDKHWARLFREYNFMIGLSIDGPEHIHDQYRRNHAGQGSWRKALDAAHLLQDQGVEVNALTVVNATSARFPEEIYAFHKTHGLTFMQFIPCVETAADGAGAASFSVAAEEYGTFLCKVFDLWLADFVNEVPSTSIRFFEALLFKYAGFPPSECTLLEECGNTLLVEHTGDVYACDFFVEPAWKLGNLLETPLEELLNSPKQVEFGRDKARLPQDCRVCEWKALCRGGCTKDRLRDPLDGGRNHFCAAYRIFFPYADGRFRQLAKTWKRKQGR